jgi:hypothetical protein
MTRILDFDPQDWLDEIRESGSGAAKPAKPAEAQSKQCRNLAGLATLAGGKPQNADSRAVGRVIDFDPRVWLAENPESQQGPPKPPKETQSDQCEKLATFATLGGPLAQIKDSPTLPELAPDASDSAWHRYFNDQIRVLNQDLARDGTSLDKELRKFRPPKPKKSADALRAEQWRRHYLVEFRPGPDTPDQPCTCGERVFWRPLRGQPWRCRSCSTPSSRASLQWFVVKRSER